MSKRASDIEVRHLRTIVAVADCGAISSAAAHIGIETSAVSRSVQEAEDRLGVSLFERHARGVRLTDAGSVYVESAREVLARLSQAEQDARIAGAGYTGQLRIGFVWSFVQGPIVGLLRAYTSAYSKVDLRTFESSNDDLTRRVQRGELDIVLTASDPAPYPRLKPIGELNSMSLWRETLCVALPATSTCDGVTWSDLGREVLLCRPSDDWRRFRHHVERLNGPKLEFREQDVSMATLLGLVAANVGWAIVPASSVVSDIQGVELAPIVSNGAQLQVEALWHPQRDNPALTRFVALLRQMYGSTRSSVEPSKSLDRSP